MHVRFGLYRYPLAPQGKHPLEKHVGAAPGLPLMLLNYRMAQLECRASKAQQRKKKKKKRILGPETQLQLPESGCKSLKTEGVPTDPKEG